MSDATFRDARRTWEASGSPADMAAMLAAWKREGANPALLPRDPWREPAAGDVWCVPQDTRPTFREAEKVIEVLVAKLTSGKKPRHRVIIRTWEGQGKPDEPLPARSVTSVTLGIAEYRRQVGKRAQLFALGAGSTSGLQLHTSAGIVHLQLAGRPPEPARERGMLDDDIRELPYLGGPADRVMRGAYDRAREEGLQQARARIERDYGLD